jgi:antitoxin component YwqK of YwqJK toxin-antitoxin module
MNNPRIIVLISFHFLLFTSCFQSSPDGEIVTIVNKNDNCIEKGLMVNGKKEGYWAVFDTNYVIQYDVQYKHGIVDGKETHFLNGSIHMEAECKKGIRNGKFTSYHKYPITQTQGYVNMGKRVGNWQIYTKDGRLNKVLRFEKDTFKVVLDNKLE